MKRVLFALMALIVLILLPSCYLFDRKVPSEPGTVTVSLTHDGKSDIQGRKDTSAYWAKISLERVGESFSPSSDPSGEGEGAALGSKTPVTTESGGMSAFEPGKRYVSPKMAEGSYRVASEIWEEDMESHKMSLFAKADSEIVSVSDGKGAIIAMNAKSPTLHLILQIPETFTYMGDGERMALPLPQATSWTLREYHTRTQPSINHDAVFEDWTAGIKRAEATVSEDGVTELELFGRGVGKKDETGAGTELFIYEIIGTCTGDIRDGAVLNFALSSSHRESAKIASLSADELELVNAECLTHVPGGKGGERFRSVDMHLTVVNTESDGENTITIDFKEPLGKGDQNASTLWYPSSMAKYGLKAASGSASFDTAGILRREGVRLYVEKKTQTDSERTSVVVGTEYGDATLSINTIMPKPVESGLYENAATLERLTTGRPYPQESLGWVEFSNGTRLDMMMEIVRASSINIDGRPIDNMEDIKRGGHYAATVEYNIKNPSEAGYDLSTSNRDGDKIYPKALLLYNVAYEPYDVIEIEGKSGNYDAIVFYVSSIKSSKTEGSIIVEDGKRTEDHDKMHGFAIAIRHPDWKNQSNKSVPMGVGLFDPSEWVETKSDVPKAYNDGIDAMRISGDTIELESGGWENTKELIKAGIVSPKLDSEGLYTQMISDGWFVPSYNLLQEFIDSIMGLARSDVDGILPSDWADLFDMSDLTYGKSVNKDFWTSTMTHDTAYRVKVGRFLSVADGSGEAPPLADSSQDGATAALVLVHAF